MSVCLEEGVGSRGVVTPFVPHDRPFLICWDWNLNAQDLAVLVCASETEGTSGTVMVHWIKMGFVLLSAVLAGTMRLVEHPIG